MLESIIAVLCFIIIVQALTHRFTPPKVGGIILTQFDKPNWHSMLHLPEYDDLRRQMAYYYINMPDHWILSPTLCQLLEEELNGKYRH